MSTIVVTYDGTDITNSVLWDGTFWQASAGAVPGTATIRCRDMGQTLSFVTGKEISTEVDGQLIWAGYVRNIQHEYAFEADFIDDPDAYENRQFALECVDFNVLLDKRVIRNTAAYTTMDLPLFAAASQDGDVVKALFDTYIDVPAGFDTDTEVENIGTVNPTEEGAYEQQGTLLREQLKTFASFTGPVYYFDADKKFHWKSLESVIKRWGLSDRPNNAPINGSPGFQDAYIGFRNCTATEDGSPITNDALIWGGSVAGSDSSVVFARAQDATSQSDHGRWQVGQVHVNEGTGSLYGNQDGVDTAADVIVFGPPGAVGDDALRGLRYAQWAFSFSWFAPDVPTISSIPDHIRPGDLVMIKMEAFGIERLMPCRQLTMRALNVDTNGDGIFEFSGEFALNTDDPWQLWSFLLARSADTTITNPATVTVDNNSPVTVYGALYQDVPSPAPNGVITTFEIPFGYIGGTLEVYLNGLLQRPGVDFFEIGNFDGEFQMAEAPTSTDKLYVMCRTLAS